MQHQPSIKPNKLKTSSPQFALTVFFGVLLVILWSVIGWAIQRSNLDAQTVARRELSNLSLTFAETVKASIETIDNSVLSLRDDWLNQPDQFAVLVDMKQRRLAQEVVFQVGIIGADGLLKFSNLEPNAKPVDFSDREHFQVHRHRQIDRLFISQPVLGRISNRWSLQFTRPIYDRSGRFDGVIVLSVAADYFTRFFETIHFQPDSISSLISRDGHVLAQWPLPAGGAKSKLDTQAFFSADPAVNMGWVEKATTADQLVRLLIWRKLEPQDLRVVLGISRDSMFATHRVHRDIYISVGAVASVLLVWFGVLFIRALRSNDRVALELRDSEERWKFALATGGDAVWDWCADMDQVIRTRRWAEMLGYQENDIAPSSDAWVSLLHPDDKSRVLEAEQAHLDGGDLPYQAEYRLRAKDGSWRWVLDRGMVVQRDAAGAPLRMIGTMSDITTRREEQQQLMDSQRFLQTLTDVLPCLVGYWRTDMTCRFANLAYQNIFHRSCLSMENLPMKSLLGEDIFKEQCPHFEQALLGIVQRFEIDLPRSDGSSRLFWAQYLPDMVDGELQGVITLLTDVTAVKTTLTRHDLSSPPWGDRSTEPDQVGHTRSEVLAAPDGEAQVRLLSSANATELDLLLVEDYKLNQDYAMGLLTLMGHRVTLANNGQEAVDLASKKRFDLVLMDVQMPLMDGFEATRQIRRNELAVGYTRVRIIAMTAYALQGEAERCFAAGMDDLVTKPFTPEELSKHLNGVAASQREMAP